MPFCSMSVRPRRTSALSLDAVSAPLVVDVFPVLKKSRRLLGCGVHGAGCPPLHHCWMRRPSIGGPQLRLTLSEIPPPLPSTYSYAPLEPWPYLFCRLGRRSGFSNV